MKKASKILLIIGGIFAILYGLYVAGGFLIASVSLGIAAAINYLIGVVSIIEYAVNNGVFTFTDEAIGTVIPGSILIIMSLIFLVVAIILLAILLILGILSLISSGKNKKGLYIANFVIVVLALFSFYSSWPYYIAAILVVIGSIFGLIALAKEKKLQEEEINPQDPELETIE